MRYNKSMLEQIIQITVIITFIASAVVFFVKIGEYKSLINNEIEVLKQEVKDCKRDIEKVEDKIETVEGNNNQIMSLLIEVKTKLEFYINENQTKFKKL